MLGYNGVINFSQIFKNNKVTILYPLMSLKYKDRYIQTCVNSGNVLSIRTLKKNKTTWQGNLTDQEIILKT